MIGIDVVDINRFKKAVEERGELFIKKIYTEKEQTLGKNKKNYYEHMAGKFAAKEAVKKALPDGAEIGLAWPEIEIMNAEDGKPYVVLHGQAKKLQEKFELTEIIVSISHTRDVAVSNAMVVKNG